MLLKKYLPVVLTAALTLTSCQGIVIGMIERIMVNDKLKNDTTLWARIDTTDFTAILNEDDIFPRPNGVYDRNVLKGSYMVSFMSLIKSKDENLSGREIADFEHACFLSSLVITDSTIEYVTSEYPMIFQKAKWWYEDDNTLVSDTGVFKEISIIDTVEGNLFANVVIDYNKKPAWYSISFDKVKDTDVALLLNTTKNNWRQPATANESDQVIKARLKSLLNYSSNYIRVINQAHINSLHTEKFLLPFKYYNGGMDISDIYENGNFDQVFYDKADAAKAYGILKAAYMQCLKEYPSKENYLVEYADFIDIVNKKI